jgi:hypothetical protein
MRSFPEIFDPSALIGVRGRQFPRREDAFQQLVGDGLRELRREFGVHVSPTRGPDGSIDIFIEPSASQDDCCLPMLPKPLIVECKDHEGGSGLRENLLAGWRKVARRLEFQASREWPGNYAPWRSARAYVYAVSARLPTAQHRRDLLDQICTFFSMLKGGPPLERIEVLDWSDLRALWEGAPRLADRWLGVGLETLLSHADQIERFTGFRSYLLEAKLPFLAPPGEDPANPDSLLYHLSEPGRERGLLLEGPGGVGKSRTLVEVAVRADVAGWRVLHAQAGEPALANEDLEATVLAGSGPTLVVFDYLDQMQLDLVRLRQRLLPAAAARGIPLALLANARPGGEGPSAAHEDLFDIVPIRPTAQRARAIADRLLATVAPRALERLGYDRLAEICGLRPIIALFIAREVERRVTEGTLSEEQLAGVRSGDLTRWLRRRLIESDLVVPPSPSRLEPSSPSPHLVAAAAILAAAPQKEAALAAAGEHALRAAGLDPRVDPSERSRRLTAVLREMGWLEARDGHLATAHDVVADEVIHDVLADRSADLVRTTELEALLAPARNSARTLGLLAVALHRVLGTEGITESIAAGLTEASASWLAREATTLGQLLPRADAEEVSYALGSAIQGKPWAEAVFALWDALVAPFLMAHAEQPAARHLLYRGLSKLPDGRGHLLFPVALRWLGRNGRLLEASFVLRPLLSRKDLESREVRGAITNSLTWLKSFGDQVEAGFVLAPLLGREDLESDKARGAVVRGLAWLESFGDRVEARFVLDSLLSREDLKPDEVQFAEARAIEWLKANREGVGEDFLLKNLLSRNDLSAGNFLETQLFAANWVRAHPLEANASFLLKRLLSQKGLAPKVAQAAADSGVVWFEANAAHPQADFVFSRLLRRPELDGERRLQVTRLGIEWLRRAPMRDDRDFALSSLLWNARLLDEDERQFLAQDTSSWLALMPRAGETVMRLETALRRVAREHAKESWVASVGGWERSEAFEFLSLTDELAERLQEESVPTVTWLASALQQVELQLQRDHPHWVGYALQCLLPLTARVAERGIGERVRALSERFWGDPTLPPKSRAGFASACYRYLDEGAWPDREAGEKVLAELGIKRPSAGSSDGPEIFQLTRELAERLRVPMSIPTEDWIKNVIDQTELALEGDHPAFAGYPLPCLLPLAAHVAEREIGERVRELVARFLGEPTLTPKNRTGFASACYRYLDEGAWPDREAGERVLASLGIERPLAPSGARLAAPDLLTLEKEAIRLAVSAGPLPRPDWLDLALAETAKPIEKGFPKASGFLFPPLLPLTARFGSVTNREALESQIHALLSDPAFSANGRKRFSEACYRFLDEEAWPDREEGERTLASLGIERPAQ